MLKQIMRNKFIITICAVFCVAMLVALNKNPVRDAYGITYNKNIYPQKPINDLIKIPQNSTALTSKFSNFAKPSFAEYFAKYFQPWDGKPTFDHENLQQLLTKRPTRYQENYQLLPEQFFSSLEQNANIAALGVLNQKAIILRNTNLRVLPTNSYLFGNIFAAGGGYPFDYAQDDYLMLGEPALISHYTKDGEFAYIKTSSGANGFVRSEDIIPVNDAFIKKFRKQLVMLVIDTLGILPNAGKSTPALQLYMSSVLPRVEENSVLIPIRNAQNKADLMPVVVDAKSYITKPLAFTKGNVGMLVNEFIGRPYGWGGNLFHMDCARLVRNYFAPFGIHMPLLSKDQGKQGQVIDLANLDNQSKLELILAQAIPYQTIIYMPGHIGIYMGEYNSEPIMLQAVWGIKLFDKDNVEYRFTIGRTVLTSLSPGKELYGFTDKSNLLVRISSISNL